jgi:hypothetical protein
MSFSDETQEYLLVRPPQSSKPGRRTAHNLQVQRLLLPVNPTTSMTKSATKPPRRRILPILNLESHAIRKTQIVETESEVSLCKFEREPRGVSRKWQVDLRRGDGGGWIFVGKYERYEWARSKGPGGSNDETVWELVRSTYSHSKTTSAEKQKSRRRSLINENKTIRASMDDTSPEQKLAAKITIIPNSPPSVVIIPRNPRVTTGVGGTSETEETDELVESVNKEEVINALIQGLWIVWREGVIEDIHSGKRNTWTPGSGGERKRGVWDTILCRS